MDARGLKQKNWPHGNKIITWKNLEKRRGDGVGGGLAAEWLSPLDTC